MATGNPGRSINEHYKRSLVGRQFRQGQPGSRIKLPNRCLRDAGHPSLCLIFSIIPPFQQHPPSSTRRPSHRAIYLADGRAPPMQVRNSDLRSMLDTRGFIPWRKRASLHALNRRSYMEEALLLPHSPDHQHSTSQMVAISAIWKDWPCIFDSVLQILIYFSSSFHEGVPSVSTDGIFSC